MRTVLRVTRSGPLPLSTSHHLQRSFVYLPSSSSSTLLSRACCRQSVATSAMHRSFSSIPQISTSTRVSSSSSSTGDGTNNSSSSSPSSNEPIKKTKKRRGIVGRVLGGVVLASVVGTAAFLIGGSYYLSASAEKEGIIVNGKNESSITLTSSERATLAIRGLDRAISAAWCGLVIGLDYKWSLRGIDDKSVEYRQIRSEVHLRSAKRMLSLAEHNRGVYVKAGQYIASLRPAIPNEYTDTMSVLNDDAPARPFSDSQRTIEAELGKPLKQVSIFR
jgi:hypothetical protein